MKTKDFNRKITSAKLNEHLGKYFNTTVNLGKYNREQLEDFRNKIRTRIFQQESGAGVNDLLTNETYQKDKAMLELLNTRIKEMLGEHIKKLKDKMVELSEGKKGVKIAKHPRGSKVTKSKDRTGDGKSDFDDVQVARMTAGGVPPKKAIAKATSDKFKESAKSLKKEGIEDKLAAARMKHHLKNRSMTKGPKTDVSSPDEKTNAVRIITGKRYGSGDSTGDEISSQSTESNKISSEQAQKVLDIINDWSWATDDPNLNDYLMKEFPEIETELEELFNDAHEQSLLGLDFWKHITNELEKMANGSSSEMQESKKPKCGHTKKTKGCKECSGMKEGKDEFGKGKNFAKIAKAAGGGEKGNRIAGKIRADKIKKAGGKVKYAKESVSQFKHNVRFVNESIEFLLNEDEEGKAKTITAAGDIVNDFTSWMQRVGQYQTKALIELADAIRADFGQAESETFKQSVAPALASTLEVLTQQRETISNAVAVLAGESVQEVPMGQEPASAPATGMEPPTEPGIDTAGPDEMNPPASDEFAAADAGSASRGMRESKQVRRARKLAEQHSIISKLAR